MTAYVEIACTYVHETEAAVLVDEGVRRVWIPKSLIRLGPDTINADQGDPLELEIAEWFANKEGLI